MYGGFRPVFYINSDQPAYNTLLRNRRVRSSRG